MTSARKRRPGRAKTFSWRGIIITIIITGIITTTITTITGSVSVDDGGFENLGLIRLRRHSLDSQKA
jgi:hypothetical protein